MASTLAPRARRRRLRGESWALPSFGLAARLLPSPCVRLATEAPQNLQHAPDAGASEAGASGEVAARRPPGMGCVLGRRGSGRSRSPPLPGPRPLVQPSLLALVHDKCSQNKVTPRSAHSSLSLEVLLFPRDALRRSLSEFRATPPRVGREFVGDTSASPPRPNAEAGTCGEVAACRRPWFWAHGGSSRRLTSTLSLIF